MAAKRGDLLLLQMGDGGSPTEVFTAAAGLRTKAVTWNGETVDITTADDVDKWRQLLAGAGIMSLAVSGSGVFKDDNISATVNQKMLAQTFSNWKITIPGLGNFVGPFQITEMKYQGEYKGELTYDLSLASAGSLIFTEE